MNSGSRERGHMEITVCFRAVPDVSLAREENWSVDPAVCLQGSLGREFDQYDECALEQALRLRDAFEARGENCALRALTLENAEGDDRLYERLFALGYGKVERITLENRGDSPALRFSPLDRARILAGHISKGDSPNLILCGARGGMAGSRLTGYGLASFLDIPCLDHVTALSVSDQGAVFAACYEGGTTLSGTVQTPALLMLGSAENSMLRVPTLKAKLAVRGRRAEVSTVAVADLGVLPENFEIRLSRKTGRDQCQFPEGSAGEKVRAILALFRGAPGGEGA